MQIVIIEDEMPNVKWLKKMLYEAEPGAEVIAVLDTIKASVEWFRNNQHPDVVLMDIRIADGLSFDIFSEVRFECPVVFVTAYDEYAVKAFKVNGLDYLLKPVEMDDLTAALDKVRSRIQQENANELVKHLLELLPSKKKIYRSRFMIPYKDELKTVQASEIAFIAYSVSGTHMFIKDGTSLPTSMTMDELEEQLDPEFFFRANRQHIVNIEGILKILQYSATKLKLILKQDPNRDILISREKAPIFKRWLDN